MTANIANMEKCNAKIENSHRWSEPDYRYPLMCLDCHILITWVWKLAKLKRHLITLEDYRYLDIKGIQELNKKITYEEMRLIVQDIEISKYLHEIMMGNNDKAEAMIESWPKTSKEIYLYEM